MKENIQELYRKLFLSKIRIPLISFTTKKIIFLKFSSSTIYSNGKWGQIIFKTISTNSLENFFESKSTRKFFLGYFHSKKHAKLIF